MDTQPTNNKRQWKILNWNIRSINAQEKWEAIRSKVNEVRCDIICLEETKREHFDLDYINNFYPQQFYKFEFLPSQGALGGCLTIWKSSQLEGLLEFSNEYGITVQLPSKQSGASWILTNIYGPCTPEEKPTFLEWFQNVDIPTFYNWMPVGDFNLIRSLENRNKIGGHVNEMLAFNEAISTLGMVELPLKGCKYTWSNMQENPLLQKLDWCFTSGQWSIDFPATEASALSRDTSDHVPILITISTNIPKPKVFRFENYWMEHPDFMQKVEESWHEPLNDQILRKG